MAVSIDWISVGLVAGLGVLISVVAGYVLAEVNKPKERITK